MWRCGLVSTGSEQDITAASRIHGKKKQKTLGSITRGAGHFLLAEQISASQPRFSRKVNLRGKRFSVYLLLDTAGSAYKAPDDWMAVNNKFKRMQNKWPWANKNKTGDSGSGCARFKSWEGYPLQLGFRGFPQSSSRQLQGQKQNHMLRPTTPNPSQYSHSDSVAKVS